MAVITTDILLENAQRDYVFEWLSKPEHHRLILSNAFANMTETGAGKFDLTLDISPKQRVVGYEFERADDSHGGRRILCKTTGKRTKGDLHYSLRTVKPSKNTLVTLHMDYEPGRVLGGLMVSMGLQQGLEDAFNKILNNLSSELPRQAK